MRRREQVQLSHSVVAKVCTRYELRLPDDEYLKDREGYHAGRTYVTSLLTTGLYALGLTTHNARSVRGLTLQKTEDPSPIFIGVVRGPYTCSQSPL